MSLSTPSTGVRGLVAGAHDASQATSTAGHRGSPAASQRIAAFGHV
jgi:hypothetical protein